MPISDRRFGRVLPIALCAIIIAVAVPTLAMALRPRKPSAQTPAPPRAESDRVPVKAAVRSTGVEPEIKRVVSTSTATARSDFAIPMERGLERITKKTVGLWVSPQNSPVQPERFTGFHVGTDFEIFPDEEDIELPVYAICTGPLVLKKWATGYGGVAVQQCELRGSPITVIYGHVDLESVNIRPGVVLKQGERIAILGQGKTIETDGQRKHLHLGVHEGERIDIRGYVKTEEDIAPWIDVRGFINERPSDLSSPIADR